jgi:hypothetical protein
MDEERLERWMHQQMPDAEWAQFKDRLQALVREYHWSIADVAALLDALRITTGTRDLNAFMHATWQVMGLCEPYGDACVAAIQEVLDDWYEVQDDLGLGGLS